jgi:hypothetical protein
VKAPNWDAIVRMLQAQSPLGELSSMQARVVFELLLQRGFKIRKGGSMTNRAFDQAAFDRTVPWLV